MPDNILFKTTDNSSRVVILYRNTWENHILVRHADMEDHLSTVQMTIENPNIITKVPEDVALIYSSLMTSKLYLQVVVGMDKAYTSGRVRTAHFTKHVPQGDYIWLKK